MFEIIKRIATIKKVDPGENLIRLLMAGAFQDGWTHSRLEIEFEACDRDSFYVILCFYSIADGSLIKRLKIEPSAAVGDTVKLNNVVASFELDIHHFKQKGAS